MRHQRRWTWLLTVTAMCFALLANARLDAGDRAVTRQDLARAYLAFDQVTTAPVQSNAWPVERREDVSRSFDALTGAFFAGRMEEALSALNAVIASCVVDDPTARERLCELLGCAFDLDAKVVEPTAPIVTGTLRALTERPKPAGEITVEVRDPNGAVRSLPLGGVLRLAEGERAQPGTYRLSLRLPGIAYEHAVGMVHVMPETPETIAVRLTAALKDLEKAGTGREQDRSATASRIALLTSQPSPSKSAQFLQDQYRLATELASEVDAMTHGRSPWKGRTGDFWRTIRAVALDVACRVYVPATLPTDRSPPLIIALHGAGGDESMFMDGYGQGTIKRLAEDHGCVVVTPSTTTFAATPVVFDAIVEEMVFTHGIDRSQVYVVGHSLGAMGAGTAARLRGDRLAGVGFIAGFGGGRADGALRTVIAAGALDPLAPIARMRPSTGDSSATRVFLEYPHDGHTLVVTAALPTVIERLLAGHASGSKAAPQGTQPNP